MATSFDQLLSAIAARLSTAQQFAEATVVTYKSGDMNSVLDAQLAAHGYAVLVTLPRAVPSAYPTVIPFYDDITIAVDIIENVSMTSVDTASLNTSMQLGQMAVSLLQNYAPMSNDPVNANFLLRLEPTGISELTSPAFVQRDAVNQQLRTLSTSLSIPVDSLLGVSNGQGYSVVSARFRTQCFPPMAALDVP